MRHRRTAGLGVAALLLAALSPGGWPGQAEAGGGSSDGSPRSGTRSVTLITGDRAVVRPGRPERVEVQPGAGRERTQFSILRTGGHVQVIPEDAVDLLGEGRLDRRLFDVTELLNAGYDDAKRADVPLIVQHPGSRGRAALASVRVPVARRLPAIDGSAARVPKRDASSTWGRLRTAKGIGRIWLDGKRRISLDHSVPQIGAPTAWERGLTGAGVTVAVLDTGIDATHADLAGKVSATADFTGEGADDGYGHGTHVASTIAGTGAASDGAYQGVAPGAKLLNGKVCDSSGWCEDSWILAGLQWAAVEKRAKVINLSLGGEDTPGADPAEAAINALTAQTGALFVVAAGNGPPGNNCRVGSPASADAALAVGAVDDAAGLATFSCVGPRVGDNALKPEITAPGVDIVAARAANAQVGEQGEDYLSMSGTSMASPHVAGAAAILAQQHPAWKAAELKAALMGTAKPNPALGVFQQGAGRVAVDQVVDASMIAEPTGLSYGVQAWPHDDDSPVSKQLTYRNLGEKPVTVRLSAELTGPDGKPAAASAVRLSSSSLEIPAGGRAQVTVTSDTNHTGPDGVYSGRITATADGRSVGTVLGVDKEIESYDLTVDRIGPDGQPFAGGPNYIFGLDNGVYEVVRAAEDGTFRLRLPKGRYLLFSSMDLLSGEGRSRYLLHRPLVQLDRDVQLTQDARAAKPVSVRSQRASARLDPVTVNFQELGSGGRGLGMHAVNFPGSTVYTAQLGPSLPADEIVSWIDVQGGEPGPDGLFRNSPYVYALVFSKRGGYFTGYERVVRDQDLITVQHEHAQQKAGRQIEQTFEGTPTGYTGARIGFSYAGDPAKITVFHTPDQGVRWTSTFTQGSVQDEEFVEESSLLSPWRTYTKGQPYRERWNVAAFSPLLTRDDGRQVMARNGDEIRIAVPLYGDGAGHIGESVVDDGWRTVLYRDGKPLEAAGTFGPAGGAFVVPPGRAGYRLEVSASRQRSGVSEFSTRLDAAWTFSSEHLPPGDPGTPESWRPIPAWTVNFSPVVDDHNRNHEGRVQLVPVTVTPNPGSDVGQLRRLSVDTSTDDGATWRKAPVLPAGNGKYVAVVVTPEDTAYVSLRTKAADSDGNSYEATIVRAYALAATS